MAHEVWNTADGIGVGSLQRIDVVRSQLATDLPVSEKRRVADHDICLWPFRLCSVGAQDRVAALDGVERLQDRVSGLCEAVAAHPLDLADPNRDARQLSRIWVNLDALDVGWSNLRELALEA